MTDDVCLRLCQLEEEGGRGGRDRVSFSDTKVVERVSLVLDSCIPREAGTAFGRLRDVGSSV